MPTYRPILAASALALTLMLIGCSDSPDALLAKAKEAIARKEPKAAEIHLKNLLQKEDRAEARFLLGKVHAAAGDYKSAEKEFERAMKTGRDPGSAGLALAEVRLKMGEMAKVIEIAASLRPNERADQAEAFSLVGRASLALDKPAEAEKAFRQALDLMPDHLQSRLGMIMLSASKDLKAASGEIDALLAKSPDAPDALVLKGDLEVAQGRPKEGMGFYEKAAAADPQNRAVRAKLAAMASEAKEYDTAQKWITELKKITGPAGGTMYLQALNDLRRGRLEAARDAILVALKNAPGLVPSHALASTIFLSLNNLEQAETHAKAVIERLPNATLGYRLIGATYLRMNSPDRALQVLEPLMERDLKDPVLLGIAGEAALRANEADKAATYFGRAAKLAPDDPGQKTGLGVARIAAGDRAGGIADLEKAVELEPSSTRADMALIAQHLRDRNWDKATAAIARMEKKEPDNPLADNLRGAAALGRADLPQARTHFEAALAKDPKYFAAVSNLAALDLREKKPSAARKRLEEFITRNPKNVEAILSVARIVEGTGGEKADVLKWLKQARDADKASVPAVLSLARFHLANKDPKEALPLLQEAVAAAPTRLELLDALGTAYLQAGDESQAISTYEKLIQVRPDSAPLQQRMGEFYMGRRDYSRALAYFRKAAELAPKALEPRAGMASALAASGKIAEARQVATALQKEAPKNPAGTVLEGDVLAGDRKFADAAAAYRRALAMEKSVPVHLKLHRVLVADSRQAEADALIKSLLAEYPKDGMVKNYAAMLEVSRKRWAQAAPLYREVVAMQPNNALALNNLAWALHELGDKEALKVAEQAYTLAPRVPEILDTYGTVLLANGQADKAANLMQQAVAGSPRSHIYRLRLAEALIARGDKKDAKREIDLVLAEVKSGPLVEQAQALVKKL